MESASEPETSDWDVVAHLQHKGITWNGVGRSLLMLVVDAKTSFKERELVCFFTAPCPQLMMKTAPDSTEWHDAVQISYQDPLWGDGARSEQALEAIAARIAANGGADAKRRSGSA